MTRYRRNAGATFSLKYHLVWCPKYRRKVLVPPFDLRLKEIIAEVAVEAERLAVDLVRRYPRALVVAGQLIFDEDSLWTRVLHNETAFLIQRRLQHVGVPMIVLPVRLDLRARRAERPRRDLPAG